LARANFTKFWSDINCYWSFNLFLRSKNKEGFIELLTETEEIFNANNENADSAPKQTVAALWGVIDIQKLMIMQNIELLNQNYGIAQQNDNIIMQNAVIINNQNRILTTLILLMATIIVIGTAGVSIAIWKYS